MSHGQTRPRWGHGVALGVLLLGAGCIEVHPGWMGSATSDGTDSGSGSATTGTSVTITTSDGTSGSGSAATGSASDSLSGGTTTGPSSTSGGGTSGGSTVSGGSSSATGAGSTGGVAPRHIFVSQTTRYGAFGGQAQGDAVCQQEADGASLGGTWRALLSTPTVDARDALDLQGPLLNMMDEVVATGDADLWDGTLGAAISYDQNGNVTGSTAWTGTEPDGTASVDTCEGWTQPTGNFDGRTGMAQASDGTWTSGGVVACSQSTHFYCVSD